MIEAHSPDSITGEAIKMHETNTVEDDEDDVDYCEDEVGQCRSIKITIHSQSFQQRWSSEEVVKYLNAAG